MPQDAHERPDRTVVPEPRPAFRLAVVPGVNPAKWLRVWAERLPTERIALVPVAAAEAEGLVRAGGADAALLRVPVDRTLLSAIPLYTETTVVVVRTDHPVVAADEVTAADLADDVLLVPADDVLHWDGPPGEPTGLPAPPTTADAIELVAAGVGVLVVPQSLARLHHRRDLTYRPVTDAPTSAVGLAWRTEGAPELVEELIGIVRGRTANSSRGRRGGATRADAGTQPDGGAAQPAGGTVRGGGRGGTPGRGTVRGTRGSGSGGGGGKGPRGGTGRPGGRRDPGRGTGTGRSR